MKATCYYLKALQCCQKCHSALQIMLHLLAFLQYKEQSDEALEALERINTNSRLSTTQVYGNIIQISTIYLKNLAI